MGAGDCTDHYCQDAAEIYWCLIVQRELVKRNLNINSIEYIEKEFNDYCEERDLCTKFNES